MYQAQESRYENMPYRKVGHSGLKLPALSLGLWHNFGDVDAIANQKALLFKAFDSGITHFDLANNYGPKPGAAEENFGRILDSDIRHFRDEMIISTKAGYKMWEGPYGDFGSRKYLLSSLDQSLKRMKLDYVDIFYHHREDPETPLEETMLALDTAVRQGKALYVGVSNYSREKTEEAYKILKELKTPFIIHQPRYNIFDRRIDENGLKDYASEIGLGMISYSPLEQGLLTDRYLNGVPEDSRIGQKCIFLNETALTPELIGKVKKLNEIASNRGQKLAQMALSWILRDGKVTSVLIGASRPSQVADNVEAIYKTQFTSEEINAIYDIVK